MTYFDAASAAPLHPDARSALLAALGDGWADPARLHREGRQASRLLETAREEAAGLLAVRPDELSFTPNGTVAAHLAVTGAATARRRHGSRVVHSAIEHSAVIEAAGRFTAVPVAVDRDGVTDASRFAAALREGAALACLISASHEVGTLQPVTEVAEACAEAGVPLYVDAAQSLGRAGPGTGWSLLSGSARKWGGPPGVGVLVVRSGTRWQPPHPRDEREAGRVPGAADLPAIVGAVAGLRGALAEAGALAARHEQLVARLRAELPLRVSGVELPGHPTRRLPHLLAVSCLYVAGEALLLALDREGFSVSSGSSCTASTLEPSHVLVAMGALTHGNIRLSLHRDTSAAEVERFLEVFPRVVERLRADAGASDL